GRRRERQGKRAEAGVGLTGVARVAVLLRGPQWLIVRGTGQSRDASGGVSTSDRPRRMCLQERENPVDAGSHWSGYRCSMPGDILRAMVQTVSRRDGRDAWWAATGQQARSPMRSEAALSMVSSAT